VAYDAGGEERRLGVVIFCLPRREVDEHLVILSQAQVRPQMVTLSSAVIRPLTYPVSWWRRRMARWRSVLSRRDG
jgi:hypothetical protein